VQELSEEKQMACHLPDSRYTGDNASMIAFAAAIDDSHASKVIDFYPNWKL
jgi:tRNA A37 threonylcarbamoyltransferase TsaD